MSVYHCEFGAEGLQDLIDDKKPPENLEEMMSHMRMMAFLLAGHNQRIKNLERQINAQDRREGARLRQEDSKLPDPNWLGRD
jgi:cell division protein FtsB